MSAQLDIPRGVKPPSRGRANYGLDAPGAGLMSLAVGIFGLGVGSALVTRGGILVIIGSVVAVAAIIPVGQAILMLHYAVRGKYRVRDHMLAQRQWSGREHMLDVGTGRGLLLIGAAKRAIAGRGIGIDIWNAADLSNNQPANTLKNAQIEWVGDRIDLRDADAQHLSFADAQFDVILSNLCLHNIPTAVSCV